LNKYLKRVLKFLLYLIGFIILLVIALLIAIQTNAFQQFAKNKITAFLEKKIGTTVSIDKLTITFPKEVVLTGVYLEDQSKDTLLAGDTIMVDISMFKLLSSSVELNNIDLRGITANVIRTLPDSAFNFDYIIKAFASKTPQAEPKDTSGGMTISVNKINLDRIRIRYDDAVTGNDVTAFLGHFDTKFKEFDLEKLKFRTPDIALNGLNVKVRQTKAISKDAQVVDTVEVKPTIYPDFQFNELVLQNINADYVNTVNGTDAKVNLSKLLVQSNDLNIKDQKIDLKKVELSGISAVLALDNAGKDVVETTAVEVKQEVESKGWQAKVSDIVINGVNFKMDDLTQAKQKKGIDFSHLDIKNLKGSVKDLGYDPMKVSGTVDNLSFLEASGIKLRNLSTDFLYGQKEAYLKNLLIELNNTVIKDALEVKYPSIAALKTDLGQLEIKANFNHSRIALNDILLFAPQLASQDVFKNNPNSVLLLHSNMSGKVNDLTIPNLEISGIGSTKLSASAHITGLPDMKKTRFEFKFKEISSTAKDLKDLLPAGTLPNTIALPDKFTMRGTFEGLTNNFKADVKLITSFGNADINAKFDASSGKGKEKYDAKFRTYGFDVGKLLKRPDQIGKVTVNGFIKGTGTDPKTANAVFDINVDNAVYNNYAYHAVHLKGQAQDGNLEAKLVSNDINAMMEGNAIVDLNGKYPSIKLDMRVDSIDFQKLKLYKDELRFHGNIHADIATADPDFLNGDVVLSQAIVVAKGKRYQLDSLTAHAVSTADSNLISLRAPFMSADIVGKYQLSKLPGILMSTIDKYYDIVPDASIVNSTTPQYFDISARIIRTPIIEQLLPELKEMEYVDIKGKFDSREDLLVLNVNSPAILYGTNELKGISMNVNTENDSLQYDVKLDQYQSGQILVNQASVAGYVNDNKIYFDVAANEQNLDQNIKLSGMLQQMAETFRFSLLKEGLTLNGEQWAVRDNNALYFGKSGIKADDFILSSNGQSISIESEKDQFNSPLNVAFKDFSIETITNIVSKDTLLIGGLINGQAKIEDLATTPHFTADMLVGDFNFKGDTLGNIKIDVNNKDLNTLAANVTVNGKGSEIDLDGFYYTKSENPLDFNLDVKNIDLSKVQAYAMGMVKDASGDLRGKLKITGSAAAPQVRGSLTFDKAKLNYAQFNSIYTLENETIRFTEDGIVLNNFTIRDTDGNRAIIDGTAYTKDFRAYKLGLNMQADNFKVLSSTKQDNELYFGKLFIDANINIAGTSTSPVVDGKLRVNEATDLTFVIPQKDPRLVEREGVIEFVDMDAPLLNTVLTGTEEKPKTGLEGLDVAMNIIIDKESIFNIIIDEGNGDLLRIRGQAQLTGGIDPSGKITLAGDYEIEEGKYNITFNFLKREFLIQKGSKITWTGAPTEADVNVTAIYIANVPPLDLISNQLSTANQTIRNTYKQRLPFEINLNMEGQLLKPIITFDIKLPTNKNYGVSNDVISTTNTRLTQLRQEPAELNKQVFAALLLNRFVGDNPFAAESGGFTGERFARQSVSKILTEQLNNLAANMIAGIDLNFDINSTEDYSSGELQNRTDLTVGLSKRLFDERLKVSVGSNFELEGAQNTQQKTTNIAGDISAEYQLTKDGRYLIRAYRKDEYVVVLGQVVETGVGFVLTVEFDKIKDIFAKKTEEFKIRERKAKKAQEEREVKQLELKQNTVK